MVKKDKDNIVTSQFLRYLRTSGFLFPVSKVELEEFNSNFIDYPHELNGKEISISKITNAIFRDEQPLKKFSQNKNLYFRRVVLAAEITNNLNCEKTFGHVKLQKLVYLSEKIVGYNLENYTKKAAGPYDNIFMHTIDNEFKRLKWFSVKKDKSSNKFSYVPLENINNYKIYYTKYFSKYDSQIQWLINTFAHQKTEIAELIATVYACMEECLINNVPLEESIVIEKFYNWSPEKEKFNTNKIIKAFRWIKNNPNFRFIERK